jgi:hypothetical protein
MEVVFFLLVPVVFLAMALNLGLRIRLMGELEGRWERLGIERPPLLRLGDGLAWRLFRTGPARLHPMAWWRVLLFLGAWSAAIVSLFVVFVVMVVSAP